MLFARPLIALPSCLLVLCGTAFADDAEPAEGAPAEPAPAEADAPPPNAPVVAATSAPAPTTDEQIHDAADTLRTIADLATAFGGASREGSRLAHAANVAADTLELGLLVARANAPTAVTRYLTASIGGGNLRTGDTEAAGELAVSAGIAVGGPTCTLLDASARASVVTRYGATLAQQARLCLGAIEMSMEPEFPGRTIDFLALQAYESAGVNVRPAVDAASITDDRRYLQAEAGLFGEGLRYFWANRRWSIAAPGVGLGGAVLGRRDATDTTDTDHEWLTRVTASAWFFELRHHRDRDQLGDFALRFFPITYDEIENDQMISALSLVPLEIVGFGTHGLYFDAKGGLDLTADDPEDTPDIIAARPDVGVGSWRLAARVGIPALHAAVISQQRLVPTLHDSAIIERRTAATLHANLRRVYLDAQAYRANVRLFEGPGDDVDATYDTWGVQGEAWLRLGDHLLAGATIELGRSFAFAPPSSTMSAPPLGHLVLAQVGWRTSHTRAVE